VSFNWTRSSLNLFRFRKFLIFMAWNATKDLKKAETLALMCSHNERIFIQKPCNSWLKKATHIVAFVLARFVLLIQLS
jgi:hypothetical protein